MKATVLSLPDYVVFRPGPDLPDGYLPEHKDGLWMSREQISRWPIACVLHGPPQCGLALPSGRYETREDGTRAEVLEVWRWRTEIAGPLDRRKIEAALKKPWLAWEL